MTTTPAKSNPNGVPHSDLSYVWEAGGRRIESTGKNWLFKVAKGNLALTLHSCSEQYFGYGLALNLVEARIDPERDYPVRRPLGLGGHGILVDVESISHSSD
jgi:hypothetical protein